MSLNLILGFFYYFFSFREQFLNFSNFLVIVFFIQRSYNHFGGEFGSSDFQERVVMFFRFLALLTVVEVGTHGTLVSDTYDRGFLTSIADNSFVTSQIFFLRNFAELDFSFLFFGRYFLWVFKHFFDLFGYFGKRVLNFFVDYLFHHFSSFFFKFTTPFSFTLRNFFYRRQKLLDQISDKTAFSERIFFL